MVISSTTRVFSLSAAPDHHDHPPGSKWSRLLPRIVLQDALSEVRKVYPPLKLRVLVDDITAFLEGRKRGTRQILQLEGDEW